MLRGRPVLFKQYKVIVVRTNGNSEDFRERIVDAHHTRKGEKSNFLESSISANPQLDK